MSKKHKTTNKQDNSPYIQQREKLKNEIKIREFNWTEKQKQLIDLILSKDAKIIFIEGPAGVSKSLVATYCALKLLNQKSISHITYVRSVIESSSKSIGALPGLLSEKFQPYLLPLEDKLDELLNPQDKQRLFAEDRIHSIPINFLRGASFRSQLVWAEESQNMTFNELKTFLTRTGERSKAILTGDFGQSDINSHSGFRTMFDLFDNEESRKNGIYCFRFQIEDVLRSGVVKYILEVIEKNGN